MTEFSGALVTSYIEVASLVHLIIGGAVDEKDSAKSHFAVQQRHKKPYFQAKRYIALCKESRD